MLGNNNAQSPVVPPELLFEGKMQNLLIFLLLQGNQNPTENMAKLLLNLMESLTR